MSGPLDGVRVLDLTTVILGPYATQILGDMGADVIKVETPSGDSTRYTGPRRSPDMAALFMGVNRNKRSIVLDLKQPEALEALYTLIEGSDVIVHNMRPQKAKKLGISPEAVQARNPKIVYAALYGYREGGAYAGRPAYDDVIQAQCGIASLMAQSAGRPRYAPIVIADKTCGLVGAYSISAALFKRERTGKGVVVEVPMFETMTSFVLVEHLYGKMFVGDGGHTGYTRVLDVWRQPYATSDGYIGMMAYSDQQWQRFWQEVDRPDLAADLRFKDLATRTVNISELYRVAGECLASRTTAEWEEALSRLEIPNAKINTLDELLNDPHLNEVGFYRTVRHETEGEIMLTDAPVTFDREAAPPSRLQPRLGQHSIEILRSAGVEQEKIRQMIKTGATGGLGRE
ncbi:CoA transferase [Bradyrhizobium sp. AS23.2]|uniref:CaiB/BaiF CoA transferase family protein n=1 Tax=Bradyrhizobium sp. AS23.2 TaxID=1680155 RepID=UPI00093EBA12|nr:CoA transferase [Bradyrhizobium sp. AS23.2]OKO83056.1 acetyl-CoA acetyltransferase [Bradyrhizobium sp. AS23.2]